MQNNNDKQLHVETAPAVDNVESNQQSPTTSQDTHVDGPENQVLESPSGDPESGDTEASESASEVAGSGDSVAVVPASLTTQKEAGVPTSAKIQRVGSNATRRKRRDRSDGCAQLAHAGREAVAQFMASPTFLRKFKSLTALAAHFKVTRMTAYRWKQDNDVTQRAYWLSMRNKIAGDFLARQGWLRIMKKVIEMAQKGDFRAIEFIERHAWAKDLEIKQTQLSASVCVADLFGTDEGYEEKEQDDHQHVQGGGR
jgi:hypothetical protein